MKKTSEIDFVITWVDDSDDVWQNERAKFISEPNTDNNIERFRNWELLKYWFRGVEKYTPWVRKIHLVTCGHLPVWINKDHPKLNIVKHQDIIPAEYLPTFNSNVIEIYLHKIQDLSDRFVYFNDDMFINAYIEPEYFFIDNKPCDMLAFQPIVANPKNPIMSHLFMNNSLVLCKYFDKRTNFKKHPFKYFNIKYPIINNLYNFLELTFPKFTGFYSVHGPIPLCKETYDKLWELEEDTFLQMSKNRFRSKDDLSPYLFREWQKLSDYFCPKNIVRGFKYFEINNDNSEMVYTLSNKHKKIVCINDVGNFDDYEKIKLELHKTFEIIFSEVSSFER